jgi:hypothetical protein
MNCRQTNILSLGRRSSYPVSSAIDAIPEGEGVIIFAVDGTPHAFDGRNSRFGRTRRDYVNLGGGEIPFPAVAQPTGFADARNIHTSPKILIPSFTS